MKLETNNIIMLAAIGFGAYYLMTRQAQAATKRPVATTTAQQATAAANANKNAAYAGLLSTGIGALSNLFGGGNASTAADPSNYYSGGQDLFAVNPVIQADPYGTNYYDGSDTWGSGFGQ
jgi:uncharacterized membrane protein YfcA